MRGEMAHLRDEGIPFKLKGPNSGLRSWASLPGGCGRRASPGSKFWGMSPQKSRLLKEKFLNICQKFQIFQKFQNKVGEIRGEIGIWGRRF